MAYSATYAHSSTDTPGKLALDAKTDDQAKSEVRDFVRTGYRNGTWCCVELSDKSYYSAHNSHGRVVARTIHY